MDLASRFDNIKDWIVDICRVGLVIGYHPEPSKSFLVTSIGNIYLATYLLTEEGFRIEIFLRHLSGYLGVTKEIQDYISEKVAKWVKYSQLA